MTHAILGSADYYRRAADRAREDGYPNIAETYGDLASIAEGKMAPRRRWSNKGHPFSVAQVEPEAIRAVAPIADACVGCGADDVPLQRRQCADCRAIWGRMQVAG